jgi:hypothetical protein
LGEVCDNVYSGVGEGIHAVIVILFGIDGIDTNGVGLKLDQLFDVALACRSIGERIDEVLFFGLRGIGADALCNLLIDHPLTRVLKFHTLICDALHEELGAIRLIKELGSLDNNRVHGGIRACEDGGCRRCEREAPHYDRPL